MSDSITALGLQGQFAVRTKTDEFEDIGTTLAVDEYEIGPEVAVAAALPGASQGVVAVPGLHGPVGDERLYDSAQDSIEIPLMPSFAFPAVVAFELTGQPERSRACSHYCHPSPYRLKTIGCIHPGGRQNFHFPVANPPD